MAFQPIDLQVNVMQSKNVADAVANEQDQPKRNKNARADRMLEERRLEQNTSDEAGTKSESDEVDEDEEENTPDHEFQANGDRDDESDSTQSRNRPKAESDKGTLLDLTT